jgi:hypothetical protein
MGERISELLQRFWPELNVAEQGAAANGSGPSRQLLTQPPRRSYAVAELESLGFCPPVAQWKLAHFVQYVLDLIDCTSYRETSPIKSTIPIQLTKLHSI